MMKNKSGFTATILTLFPEMFPGSLSHSLAGAALEKNIWNIEAVNIRDFATDKHKTVDDTVFGGGTGLVMRADVVDAALKSVADRPGPKVFLTPRGTPLTQGKTKEWAKMPGITFLCGRYEGVDDRVVKAHDLEEISVGDFVLSGGEPAALVALDSVVRLLPGVMGNSEKTLENESFEHGLLEHPHYTRPQNWNGQEVPEILTSGHHAHIEKWRLQQAMETTRIRRPDLWEKYLAKNENKAGKKQANRL